MEAASVVAVEAPEVDEFASGVYLCLKGRLGLVQHRRSVDPHAPVPCQQVCTALEYGTTAFEAEVNPVLLSLYCRVAGGLHLGPPCQMYICDDVAVVVRDDLGCGDPGIDSLAVDDAWYLDYLVHLPVHLGVQ